MRSMIDALYPLNIPLSVKPEIIASYINHPSNPQAYTQAVDRFPNAIHVTISIDPNDVAQVLDCEATDARPDQCPAWATACREQGIEPTVYCGKNTWWPDVQQAFATSNVTPVNYWVADYAHGQVIPDGAVALQYIDTGTYDVSNVRDYWSTIDPLPTPVKDDDMFPNPIIIGTTASVSKGDMGAAYYLLNVADSTYTWLSPSRLSLCQGLGYVQHNDQGPDLLQGLLYIGPVGAGTGQ
jgi:hypothetical protein